MVLIIYVSVHNKNTEKIARAMSESLKCDIAKLSEVDVNSLDKYDLIGFGSGIFNRKHHKSLLKFVDKLAVENKKAFVFSTASFKLKLYHRSLKKKLKNHGFNIVSEFLCKGYYNFGPFKLLNRNKPDPKDIEAAEKFAQSLIS